MNKWEIAWAIVRDVGLTGFGVFLVFTQVYSKSPQADILAVALALMVPSVRQHAKKVLNPPSETTDPDDGPEAGHSQSSPSSAGHSDQQGES